MGKDWGPGAAGAGYTGKRSRSTAPDPYGWPPAGKPNVACRVPSSACELRWTLEMVSCPDCCACLGMQYFLMKDLLIGGWMSFVGITGIP